jgi:hypothetical protein
MNNVIYFRRNKKAVKQYENRKQNQSFKKNQRDYSRAACKRNRHIVSGSQQMGKRHCFTRHNVSADACKLFLGING